MPSLILQYFCHAAEAVGLYSERVVFWHPEKKMLTKNSKMMPMRVMWPNVEYRLSEVIHGRPGQRSESEAAADGE